MEESKGGGLRNPQTQYTFCAESLIKPLSFLSLLQASLLQLAPLQLTFNLKLIIKPSVADPDLVRSGLFFRSAGSGSEIFKTGSADPDPVQMRTDPLSINRPFNSTLLVI